MPLDVFPLLAPDGRPLPPAVQATVLAKYSRSPLSARQLVQEVTPEQAEAFQLKWGVTFGHSSVAELACPAYSFEGISILATKEIEKWQRAGYSEKSTRYQEFSRASWVEPPGAPPALREAAMRLYDAYQALQTPMMGLARARCAPGTPESVVKGRAFDSLRYLLPAGTGTSVGAVYNARDARYCMSDLLGSPNPEFRQIGEAFVSAAKQVAPVFAMGAKPSTFEPPIVGCVGDIADILLPNGQWRVQAERITRRREVSQFRYRLLEAYRMTEQEFYIKMARRGKEQVPSLFKRLRIAFDIVTDYGSFRDLQRHRRCEQYVQTLTPDLGYLTPDDIAGTDMEPAYQIAVGRAFSDARRLLAEGVPSLLVQYALPLATLHRSVFDKDLRQVYYMTELRTQPQGHISYRRVAWAMAEEAKRVYPWAMQWCRAIQPEKVEEHR